MGKRVMIYSPAYAQWGGGHLYIDILSQYLNKKGFESKIFTSTPQYFKSNCIEIKDGISYKGRLLEAKKVAKEYKSLGYKIVILNDLSSIWLAPIFRLYGFKVFALLHNYLREGDGKGLGHTKLQMAIIKFSAKFCKVIFSVNRENIEVFGAKRVVFVSNFISDWFFKAKRETQKIYDFLIVARLAKQKNIPLFLKILSKLNSKYGSFNLLIVGEGEEEQNIKDAINKYKLNSVVSMRGWVDREKLPSIYDSAKCFVISSYHEGFATTLLEAHARGLSAIVTKSSGFCAEFVQDYGAKSGIVFDLDDLNRDSFYKEIVDLVKNSHKYRDICLKKAKEFSEDRVLGKIYKVLEDEKD